PISVKQPTFIVAVSLSTTSLRQPPSPVTTSPPRPTHEFPFPVEDVQRPRRSHGRPQRLLHNNQVIPQPPPAAAAAAGGRPTHIPGLRAVAAAVPSPRPPRAPRRRHRRRRLLPG
uniref:Uncharacterized protein n=1 Tax=Aegilops tauschii subsp. strangulata TaxID=200361 RepID=A0A453HE49_AEGTS